MLTFIGLKPRFVKCIFAVVRLIVLGKHETYTTIMIIAHGAKTNFQEAENCTPFERKFCCFNSQRVFWMNESVACGFVFGSCRTGMVYLDFMTYATRLGATARNTHLEPPPSRAKWSFQQVPDRVHVYVLGNLICLFLAATLHVTSMS